MTDTHTIQVWPSGDGYEYQGDPFTEDRDLCMSRENPPNWRPGTADEWAVTEWLAKELLDIGECVLDNVYGYWWGRQCSGQAIKMDGTLQEIARRHV